MSSIILIGRGLCKVTPAMPAWGLSPDFRAKKEQLKLLQQLLAESPFTPTPRPESGLDCLICTQFARQRKPPTLQGHFLRLIHRGYFISRLQRNVEEETEQSTTFLHDVCWGKVFVFVFVFVLMLVSVSVLVLVLVLVLVFFLLLLYYPRPRVE